MKTKLLLFFVFICCNFELISQDLHSSNYDYNLLYLNPAETGSFLGTFRLAASHRDQFDAFIAEPYKTQIAQIDMPLNLAFTKNSWTGYGLTILSDKSGDLGFRNTGVMASLSYHMALDRKYRSIISFGLQISQLQRSLTDPSQARFSDALIGGGQSMDALLIDQFSQNSTDYNFGIKYQQKIDKRSSFNVGVAGYRLGGFVYKKNQLDARLNFYGSYSVMLNQTFGLEPRLVTSFSNNAYNVNLQLMSSMNFQNRILLKGGLGYRVQDALQLLFALEYRSWDIGLAYDVTVSSAREFNNSQGGFELGLKRVFTLKKKPKTEVIEICPRL